MGRKVRQLQILCMANSRKLSGRCVAGLRLDDGGWIRPVSDTEDGTLYHTTYTLGDGTPVRPLDVLEIEVVQPRPEPHQPENWVLGDRNWKLVSRPAGAREMQCLEDAIASGSVLLGNTSDRVSWASLTAQPAAASLALVEPDSLEWQITTSFRGRLQTRAHFRLGGASYDLVVTDLVWESRLEHLGLGVYKSSAADISTRDRVLLTVSLGEPFEGYCYKLVAAVLVLPA